jgi:acyl-coenzyme A thioesterase 13
VCIDTDVKLTDTVTSLALSTMGIPPPTGASVNISCEFVRPAGKVGEELYSIGEVVKLGKSSSLEPFAQMDAADNQAELQHSQK